MPINGQANARNFFKNLYGNPGDGKANNDVFTNMNLDQHGNVINGGSSAVVTSSAAVERKTPTATATASTSSRTTIKGSTEKNVLSTYRSYTYRFTLACLNRDEINNPNTYTHPNALKLIVLKSGGKGPNAINEGLSNSLKNQITASQNLLNAAEVSQSESTKATQTIDRLNSVPKLVESFNKYSAGQYDMYIENVQIETIATFTQMANATLPTTIGFDVIEPYSVNGFLEALATSARAAGWDTYIEAPYVLLVEWIGYPDSSTFSEPEPLKEKRYITIKFSGMEVDITEKGTVYKCSVFPWGDVAHGISGKLTANTSVEGSTVGEILSELVKAFNNQLTVDRNQTQQNTNQANALHDLFDIKFDTVDNTGNFIKDPSPSIGDAVGQYQSTDISDSVLYSEKDAKLIAMLDPQNQTQDGVNYPNRDATASTYKVVSAGSDKKPQIAFNAGSNLRDIIAEVIVNSEYVRSTLKDMYENGGEKSVDPDGFVNYFLIRVDTEELPGRDEIRNTPLRKYIFRISPYKVLRSKFPGFAKLEQPLKDLEKNSCRSYDYIYTGKNTEILDFKLQYNYLFYEGLPRGDGINDSPKTKDTPSPVNPTKPTENGKSQTEAEKNKDLANPSNPVSRTAILPPDSYSIGDSVQRQDDPYFVLAENLHRALIDPRASMVLANINIIGDPFFLVTGGIGNQVKTSDRSSSIDFTQAQHLYGDMIVDIKFQNPQDIGDNGFITYNKKVTSPFHGAYIVNKIVSTFKEGQFKQNLELRKIAGQDPTNTVQVLDRDNGTTGSEDKAGAPTTDARDKSKASVAGNDIPLSQYKLGAVNPYSNYSNLADGLGSGPLTQSFGAATNGIGKFTAQANIYGNSVVGGTPSPIINWNLTSLSVAGVNDKIANIQGNINSALPPYLVNPNLQLTGLTNGLIGNTTEKLNSIYNTIPTSVDISQAIADGLVVKDVKNLNNIPATQPKTVAPPTPLTVDDQQVLATKGAQGLADRLGVSVSELSSDVKKAASTFLASNNSPLGKLLNGAISKLG